MLLIRARDLAKHILGLVLSCLPGGVRGEPIRCLPGGGVRGELIIIVFKILWSGSAAAAAAAAGKRDTGGGAGGVGGINQSMHT